MAEVPFELRYHLTRRQRLVPHLILWGAGSVLIPFGLLLLLASALVTVWALLGAFLWALVFRNFVRGLIDVAVRRSATMDLRVEENGLGFLNDGRRWWLFLDGLLMIDQLTPGVWTLWHRNGSVVNIPADAITDGQLAHLRAATARGRQVEADETGHGAGRSWSGD